MLLNLQIIFLYVLKVETFIALIFTSIYSVYFQKVPSNQYIPNKTKQNK